ncbi:MAG: M48 family peptidase [Actinobacteria bacterium]|nr:MAG: M48 family peptidase [Actinomycetota bacterium]
MGGAPPRRQDCRSERVWGLWTIVRVEAVRFFSAEEVARARSYHRPLYWAAAVDGAIQVGVLAAFVWSGVGNALDPDSLPWWARTPAYAAIVIVVSAAVRTPGALWSGLIRERRWGFSTQRLPSWAADRCKAAAVNVVLTSALLLGLVALARELPGWWAAPAAGGFALATLALSYLAPVVLEPLFNRYSQLPDAALAAELRALAQRAGVATREVLVQDTSRRTRKANAYVSGLGRTRRIVVSDTLLEQAPPAEVRLVVAHELGHRRKQHQLRGTVLAITGAIASTVVLWALLGTRVADPHRVPLLLLLGLAFSLSSLPALTAVSRRWERQADRYSLELTGDDAAYVAAFRRLARTNLSDLDPPRLLYLLLFTHPTPPERLAAADV